MLGLTVRLIAPMTEEELHLPAPDPSERSPSPPVEDDPTAYLLHISHSNEVSAADSADNLISANGRSSAPPNDREAERVNEDSTLAAATPPFLSASSAVASEHTAKSTALSSVTESNNKTELSASSDRSAHLPAALPVEQQRRDELQQYQSATDSSNELREAEPACVDTASAPTTSSNLADAEEQQKQPMVAQHIPTPVSTSLATTTAATGAAPTAFTVFTAADAVDSKSTGSPGRMHPRSPSTDEWHSILLSKQQSQLSVKAVQSLPSPPSNDRKRRRGKPKDETPQDTEPTAATADAEDEGLISVAARLRGRRAKRDAQEENQKEEQADEMSVDEDEPVVLSQQTSSSRAEIHALLDSDDLSAPSLSSSSLLLSSLDSFSSSFHSTLTQLTSSLNSQIEQHQRSLHSDWHTQLQQAHSTQQHAITQAVEAEASRWQSQADQWAQECRRVRGELDGLRDVQLQLRSLMTSHPALEGDEKVDSEDKMELFIQYYREKERGMRDKEKKLATREKDVKEREEKVEVRVMYVTQEKKREVDDMREKAVRMRNEWEVERAKVVRERKELREKVEEMKLERMMRESEVGKLKGRVKELTDTMAVMETRMRGVGGAVGSGSGGGGVVKEEKKRMEVDVVEKERERERREKQDKYVADVEEYLRRQSAELKELRAAEAASREEMRRKEEAAGLEKRKAELEERKRVEAEMRWSESEKQRADISRQLAALQADRDNLAEQLRAGQTRKAPPPLLPSLPQQHAAPVTHMVHPSRAATVPTYTAPPAPPVAAAPVGGSAGSGGGLLNVDSFALVREMTLKLEQEKKARERQAAIDQRDRDERDRQERDRLARIEADQRLALERIEAIEREKREREQREQIEREELQRLAEVRSGAGGGGTVAGGGWKSVKVTAMSERAQPPLLPMPTASANLIGVSGPGHTGRVCSFFSSPRGCRKGDHCDHLHVPAVGGAGGAGMMAMLGKRDEKEEGELDELPMLVR